MLSREVASPGQLRAVVEWARRNERVEKCSYELTWALRGVRIETCPAGHTLLSPVVWQPYRTEQRMRRIDCRLCPGHYVTLCPTCACWVFDPPRQPGCGPVAE